MASRVFLDTNVFVYSFDATAPKKRQRAQELIEDALVQRVGVISYQVLQEFLNVALQRFRVPLSVTQARAYMDRVLLPLCEVFPTARLYAEAISIKEETGWSFYDSLVVSSALIAKCDILLTEDLQNSRVVRGVEIRNPFAEARRLRR